MNTMTFPIKTLEWAANNIGLQLRDVAFKISNSTKTREKILAGILSIPQAEQLAKETRVPFGYLFIENPPKIDKPSIPDLRQLQNHEPLGFDFEDTLKSIKVKQAWYIDYLKDSGASPLEFVGLFSPDNASYLDITKKMRDLLNLNDHSTLAKLNEEEYLKLITTRIEEIGVLVFRNGVVNSNTKRKLNFREFRGFALVDNLAPAIFINGSDAKSAWIFTLIHELAHIFLNVEGVSDFDTNGHNPIEVLCNKVAGEFLVPQHIFVLMWDQHARDYSTLSKYFKVSRLVIARRALDLKKIHKSEYEEISTAAYNATKKQEGGGNAYFNYPIRNSRTLLSTITNQALSGSITLREAARVMNMSPHTIMTYARDYAK